MPVATAFKDYYAILGITKGATDEDIKAAYKNLALKWHPDRHPAGKEDAARKFIEINDAYKFLIDKGRREWYDNFPSTGDRGRTREREEPTASKEQRAKPAPPADKKPSGAAADPGGGLKVPKSTPQRAKSEAGLRTSAPERPSRSQESPPPSRKRARSTLGHDEPKRPEADLRSFLQNVWKKGSDAPPSKEPSLKSRNATVYDPSDSEGPSIQTTQMQLHTTTVVNTGVPSEWIFPLPLTLEELKEGTSHRYKITRHLLSGNKRSVFVDIDVLPGWKKGTKIRFPGAGNERVDGSPQDVVFVVEELPHPMFVRRGSSLVARVQISLLEALTGDGKTIFIQGVDEKKIAIQVPKYIIKPGDETIVPGAGMPIRKKGKNAGVGDLVVKWEIAFPEHLSKAQQDELQKSLQAI